MAAQTQTNTHDSPPRWVVTAAGNILGVLLGMGVLTLIMAMAAVAAGGIGGLLEGSTGGFIYVVYGLAGVFIAASGQVATAGLRRVVEKNRRRPVLRVVRQSQKKIEAPAETTIPEKNKPAPEVKTVATPLDDWLDLEPIVGFSSEFEAVDPEGFFIVEGAVIDKKGQHSPVVFAVHEEPPSESEEEPPEWWKATESPRGKN